MTDIDKNLDQACGQIGVLAARATASIGHGSWADGERALMCDIEASIYKLIAEAREKIEQRT